MKRISRRLSAARRALLPLLLPMLLAGCLLLASACRKADEVPVPAQLLPPDKMVDLLVELHALEARTEATGLPADSSRALFLQEQKKVYWRYEVSDSSFAQSFRYYAAHNQDLSNIYKLVVDSLAAREK